MAGSGALSSNGQDDVILNGKHDMDFKAAHSIHHRQGLHVVESREARAQTEEEQECD